MENVKSKIGFAETPKEIAKLMVDLSSIEKDGIVLDTGCGRGIFLQILKEQGYKNTYGTEIDEEFHSYCSGKFGNIIFGDFLEYNFKEQFDLIIGNPPYVHFNQLPYKVAKNVEEIIGTREGDIYYAFIVKAISLLKENGELIYIVPYHFFYNTYAKFLRETILKFGKIEIIIDLDETRLFKKENPETIIFKFKKGKYNLEKEKIRILKIKTVKSTPFEIYTKAVESLKYKTSNDLFDYYDLPHYLDAQVWSTSAFSFSEFSNLKLKNVAKVGVGLVSGFDKAFIVSPDELKLFTDVEMNLVNKLIKAKHCKRFLTEGHDLYIIIDERVKSEEELKENYPNIYKKIIPLKSEMLKRYLSDGKDWFHWQALRNYKFLISHLDKKKIFVPVLDRHKYSRFSLGQGGLLPHGDVLFIQPYSDDDLFFLLGYLNSTFFRNYYLSKGARRGGRISFTQKLLENIELPFFADEVKEKVKEITKEIVFKMENNKDASHLEKELDNLVNSCFDPTKFRKVT
ncbi:MAG TPA: class I SAM-dependent methyltransferase [Thermodesulfobium narugense]|nr:class I SAM-dependent methyltransferase [Thermodesulfobium narugense]